MCTRFGLQRHDSGLQRWRVSSGSSNANCLLPFSKITPEHGPLTQEEAELESREEETHHETDRKVKNNVSRNQIIIPW